MGDRHAHVSKGSTKWRIPFLPARLPLLTTFFYISACRSQHVVFPPSFSFRAFFLFFPALHSLSYVRPRRAGAPHVPWHTVALACINKYVCACVCVYSLFLLFCRSVAFPATFPRAIIEARVVKDGIRNDHVPFSGWEGGGGAVRDATCATAATAHHPRKKKKMTSVAEANASVPHNSLLPPSPRRAALTLPATAVLSLSLPSSLTAKPLMTRETQHGRRQSINAPSPSSLENNNGADTREIGLPPSRSETSEIEESTHTHTHTSQITNIRTKHDNAWRRAKTSHLFPSVFQKRGGGQDGSFGNVPPKRRCCSTHSNIITRKKTQATAKGRTGRERSEDTHTHTHKRKMSVSALFGLVHVLLVANDTQTPCARVHAKQRTT